MSLTKFLPDAIFRVLLCVLFVESDNVDNGFGVSFLFLFRDASTSQDILPFPRETYGKLAGAIVNADMSDMDRVLGSRDGSSSLRRFELSGRGERLSMGPADELLRRSEIGERWRGVLAGQGESARLQSGVQISRREKESTVRRYDTQLGVLVDGVLGEVGKMVVGEPVVGAQLRLGQVAREMGIGRSARLIGRVRRRVVLRADGSRGASA
ncbi:hypothetical protein KCU70_g362, partial [Aureobasidium melanogenum]